MSETKQAPDFYLSSVWRMLFDATREEHGWVALSDPARLHRIEEMAKAEGRILCLDLDSAQAAVDAGMNRGQWKASLS